MLAAAMLSGAAAYAQPQPVGTDADPPVRVGRISYLQGEVSFSPAGSDEWVHARVNRPIVAGDRVWADNDGRAEFAVDNSTWWLGEQTSVTVSNLDDRIVQLQLQQGTVDVHVRRLPPGNIVEIDTPNLAFSLTRPGRYRVGVDPQDGATTVVVRSGTGEVYGENASYVVTSGEAYRFYGSDLADSEYIALPPPDPFDRWVAERDRRYDRVVSARYVSPEVIGYEDLDRYGNWSAVADYGNVWFPRTVRVGWAPYREGHWAWIDPWGWTWVDDEPWGFAPFHYGRWAYFDRGWGWIPGPRAIRPVYAPALVAFVGGAGFSVAISSGPAIGWFPLGPREVYVPPYSVSRNYFRQVNVSNTVINNTTIINNYYNNPTRVTQVNYVNRRAPDAVTAVPPSAFAQAQNVARAAVAVPAAAVARAEVHPVARVAPARPAFLGAAPVAQAKPPATTLQRAVVAKVQPPPPPVPDAQRLQALEKNPGRPLNRTELQSLRRAAPPVAATQPAVKLVEQPKPAPSAAPPARAAGATGSRRAAGATVPPAGAAPPASAAERPGTPGPRAAPEAPETKGPPVARPSGIQPPGQAARTATPSAAPPGAGRPAAVAPGGTPPAAAALPGGSPEAARGPRGPAERPTPSEARSAPAEPRVATQPQGRGAEPGGRPQAGPPGQVARPPESRAPEPEANAIRGRPQGGAPAQAARPAESRPSGTPPAQRAPEERAASQRAPQPARPPEAQRPLEARPQPQRAPEARPQPQRPPEEQRSLEARPQPQRAPEARPQPQRPPETRAEPQRPPQARPQPEARGGPPPQQGQPERPQGEKGKGNDKKDKKDEKE